MKNNLSLKEALYDIGYDVSTEKNEFGNLLVGNLSLEGIHIDFSKSVNDLSEEEIYQLGRTVVLEKAETHIMLSGVEIVEKMKNLLKIGQ
jgi:hypothetical protein